jgi:hypothetical protein
LYDIELFHAKYGLYWWNKYLHVKKVKTIIDIVSEVEPVFEKLPDIAVFDFDKTLFEEVPILNTIQMLQLYVNLNIPILILTGRHILEEDVIHATSSYTLKCRPSSFTVNMHKCTVMKKLALHYHTIYHF